MNNKDKSAPSLAIHSAKSAFWHQMPLAVFFAVLFMFIVFPTMGFGQNAERKNKEKIIIQADSMERDSKNNKVYLEGNVQIIFKNQHLKAQKAQVDLTKKEFIAENEVVFVTPKSIIAGQKVIMNYEKNLGTIFGGFVQSGALLFEGEVIEKVGDEQYLSIDGEYTACSTCPPAWSFSGSEIKAEIEGYAFIKNALLRFGRLPVFWLPYLVVPLKSTRQTGLLPPTLDYSTKGGLAITQSLFWAINESQDATISLKNYDKRGLKTLLNYRYILGTGSQGEFNFNILTDRVFLNEDRTLRFRGNRADQNLKRWYLKYEHYYTLPENWVQRVRFNNTSDLQYPTDFPDETLNQGDPAIENRVSLSKTTDEHFFLVDTMYYINTLRSNPLTTKNDSVHRLPEIKFERTLSPLLDKDLGLFYSYSFEYTQFTRNDFAYDDLQVGEYNGKVIRTVKNNCLDSLNPSWEKNSDCEKVNDGSFFEGQDLIRAGQRLSFEPRLLYPFKAGRFLQITPSVSYRETHYSFGVSQEPNITRRLVRSEVSMKTLFSRIFNSEDVRHASYKHEIIPEVIATSQPWIEQPKHPFFGFDQTSAAPFFSRDTLSDEDLYGNSGLQFDYQDRLYDRNLITYRVHNKLIRKTPSASGGADYKQIVYARLSQTYDVFQANLKEGKKPWSDIEMLFDIRFDQFDTVTRFNYFPYQNVTNTSSRFSLFDNSGNYFQLGLSRQFVIPEDGPVNPDTRTEDWEIGLGSSFRYLNFSGKTIYDGNEVTAATRKNRFKSWTYAVIVKPPGECWSIYFTQEQVVGGDSNYRINFDFLFDGKNSTGIGNTSLQRFGI